MMSTLALFKDLRRPVRLLEIGSWAGCSALSWAEGLGRIVPQRGELTCVDQWKPYFSSDDTNSYRTCATMNQTCQKAEQALHTNAAYMSKRWKVKVRIFKGASRTVLLRLLREGETFDLVYVDGDHTFPNVLTDLALGAALVSEGGILCGDDLEVQLSPHPELLPLAQANCKRDFIPCPAGDFHPGVSLAVDAMLGEVSCFEGYWLMRRSGDSWSRVDQLAEGFWPEHLKSQKVVANNIGVRATKLSY